MAYLTLHPIGGTAISNSNVITATGDFIISGTCMTAT